MYECTTITIIIYIWESNPYFKALTAEKKVLKTNPPLSAADNILNKNIWDLNPNLKTLVALHVKISSEYLFLGFEPITNT